MDPQDLRTQEYLKALGHRPGYSEWLAGLPEEKRRRIAASTTNYKYGLHAAAPLTCKGPSRCPFYDACPIPPQVGQHLPEGEYPIGLSCVLEGEFINQKCGEYMVHLHVDPSNPVEMSIVQELALIDLYKNRALLVTSHGDRDGQGRDFLHVDESITGFTDNGTPLTSKTTKLHPVVEYVDKLERRREKWLDRLMETRKAQAAYAIQTGNANKESKMLEEIADIKTFLAQMGAQPQLLELDDKPIGLDEEL